MGKPRAVQLFVEALLKQIHAMHVHCGKYMWLLYSFISSSAWAVVNILDSILVHKYEKNPAVLLWFNGVVRILVIFSFPLFVSVRTPYWFMLFGVSAGLYLASLLYFRILEHLDTSVTQSAWAIESIFLSLLGFAFLSEHWSLAQTFGSVLILTGVFLLSYWHRHISVGRTMGFLALLALIGTPAEFSLKFALGKGVPYLAILFWYQLGTNSFAVLFPLFRLNIRKQIAHVIRTVPWKFYGTLLLDISFAFLGLVTVIRAFDLGPLSLVSIANNCQPFLIMLFVWLLLKTKTTHIPKELLTRQSVQVKLFCFAFVFAGLALLVVNGHS